MSSLQEQFMFKELFQMKMHAMLLIMRLLTSIIGAFSGRSFVLDPNRLNKMIHNSYELFSLIPPCKKIAKKKNLYNKEIKWI